MREPLQEYARNIADLQKIPLFNPRFLKVYGVLGIATILLVAISIFVAGLMWLAPWNPNYLPSERHRIWLGVAVMPIAGLLAGSYIVEFILKGAHVVIWAAKLKLRVDVWGKFLGTVSALLLISGTLLSHAGAMFDLYGYLFLVLSVPCAYGFITLAWKSTDEKYRHRL